MCGIVGGVWLEPPPWLADEGRLRAAIDCLAHRGPDDRGCFFSADRRVFLGHRRLSIIDLTGGHQPLVDESGQRHLIYNGEIYNHRALRAELIQRGHTFRTHSDGETALHLYEENPGGFETALSGMFAIAILDEPARRLTLARDRLGIKPLYYHFDGQRLLFASEIKAILALLDRRPEISAPALRQYLRWKYVPAPLTIYENIFELPPAHRLELKWVSATNPIEMRVARYWDVDYGGEKITDERAAIEMLDQKLRAAVQSHLEADVEVGALLSGGVDSSLVVALAAQLSNRRIKTFSVGFREPGFDQLPFARALAEKYNTEHYEEYVELDPLATVPKLVQHFDQPFADSSALACYAVCQTAAKHVKVALTGDGGDETFAGYQRYQDLLQAVENDSARRRWTNRLLFTTGSALFSPEAKFLLRARAAALPPLEQYAEREVMCGDWLTNKLLAEPFRAKKNAAAANKQDEDAFDRFRRIGEQRGWPAIDIAQYADLNTYLPGDILPKVDRTSMACSLECRVPLLDHSITEFAARLLTDLKIRTDDGRGRAHAVGKYLLKRVAEKYVPPELLYRKKRGFRVPIRRWFKRELLDQTEKLLLNGVLVQRGVLDPTGLRWIFRNQRRPWMNLSSCLWALLFLEHWGRIYPERFPF